MGFRAKSGRTTDWKGDPLTAEGKRFYDLRESGYKGRIDQNGRKGVCLACGKSGCTAGLTEKCNG